MHPLYAGDEVLQALLKLAVGQVCTHTVQDKGMRKPVPGAPTNRTPAGERAPSSMKRLGFFRNSTSSRISALTWSMPSMSLKVSCLSLLLIRSSLAPPKILGKSEDFVLCTFKCTGIEPLVHIATHVASAQLHQTRDEAHNKRVVDCCFEVIVMSSIVFYCQIIPRCKVHPSQPMHAGTDERLHTCPSSSSRQCGRQP